MAKAKKIFSAFVAVVVLATGGFGYYYVLKNYPKAFASSANIENQGIVDSDDPIVIDFGEPVFRKTLDESISITPKTDASYYWVKQNRRLIIAPKDGWQLNSTYHLDFTGGRNIFGGSLSDGEITFETEKYPKLISFFPENNSIDVVLDIEDPISLEFDKPIDDYEFRLAVDPQTELAYEKLPEKNGIKLMPKSDFQKGMKYIIAVWMKHKKADLELKIADSAFTTKEVEPQTWDKDFMVRLQQAKKFTAPLIKEGKYIDINLKSQVMTLFENGKAIDSFLVSSGKRGMDTPVMETKIYNKFPRAWSKTYQLFMPFWMAIRGDGKYGIHELPEWPGGYKEGANHLGTPVSHGCVRLGVGSADVVYSFAEIGTPVITHY